MTDARDRGWGNPDNPLFRVRNIRDFTHSGIKFPGGVHKRVKPLMHALLDELEASGYRLKSPGCWGYANRDIRGRPGVKSNHSWGLALDVNAPANPMTSDGVVHTNLPPNAGKIAKRYGFIWGGDYTGTRKDPMHFEFAGTKKNALARVVQLKGTRTLPIPSTDKLKGSADVDWVTLRQGDHGQKVENVQALLSVRGFPEIEVDGTYGRGMTLKVREFQKKHGIRQTGNVGPYTMKALLKANID